MLGSIFGSLLAMLAFTSSVAYADIGDRLEVFKSNKMLYAGPSATASRLVTLRLGEQMVEMERQGAWVFVALKSSGAQGWVSSSVLRNAPRKVIRAQHRKSRAKRSVAKKAASKAVSSKKVTLKTIPEATAATPETAHVTRQVSLKDLGFEKGIMFEGAVVSHARTFFFPAPMDSHITNGSFRLLFRASPKLHEMADVRVTINDIPYRQVGLPTDGAMHEMDVLLPSSAFKGGLVKVTVHTSLPVSENRCFDERLSDIFLHILPETSLTVSYQPVETSIRDAWRMLPQHVTLSLSEGQLSKEQFASTLAVMAMLVDDGKEVKIVRLPEIGDIVVAPKLSIERLLDKKLLKDDKGKLAKSMSNALDHVSNLALVRFESRSSIVVTDPYDVQPMYLLSDEWKLLSAGQHYRVYRPDNMRAHIDVPGTEGEADYYSLPLPNLGMDTAARFITREVTWDMVINPYALPMGVRADFLNLNIIAPVHWEKDPSYELYVFLNDVMVKSVRLADTGQRQHFTIGLPIEYQKQYNHIRIVVQHDIESGDCKGVIPFDFVQVTPDSALVVKRDEGGAPARFSDLSRYLLAGFDTYLEASYLDNPERVLQLLARLAADFPLLIDHSRLNFKAADTALQPEQPFIAVGRFTLGADVEAPVRFDRGRIKIQSPDGKSYFDVNQLSRITIAEIVKTSTAYGLWVVPSEVAGLPLSDQLDLSEDDVAFIDSFGVVKTMDSSAPSLAQVYYPDVEDWFDVLGRYRFWFMVLLWFLLTMVVVYLYRMSRSNKLAREEDDELYQMEEDRMQGKHAAHLHDDDTHYPGDSHGNLDEKR